MLPSLSAMTRSRPLPGWLVPISCLIATGIVLGVTANFAKVAVTFGLNPLSFLTWSVLGGGLILLAVNLVKRRLPALNARTMEYFFVAALISVAAPNLIFFAAVPHVGVSFVALAIAFPPLLTYVGALALGMEQFSSFRALGVMLALSGAALLAVLKLQAPDAPTFWVVLTLFGPVLLATGNLYRTLRWPPGSRPDELAPGMLMAATAILLPAALLPGLTLSLPALDAPLATEAWVLIGLQALCFAAQFLLFFILQKTGGPVLLSLLGSVAAVFGVPVAVFLLGESPPDGLLIGAALIFLGIFFVVRGAPSKAPSKGD